jgi:tetratricopeptide (TPR) repeat protein
MAEILEDDAFYVYEDTLVMGHELLQKGGPSHIADRLNRRLKRLKTVADHAQESDREAWETLLCRYNLLTATFARHRLQMDEALTMLNEAVSIADKLKDDELSAFSLYRRTRVHLDRGETDKAKEDIDEAMQYLDKEQVNIPLKGNIYLTAAEVNIPYTKDNKELEKKIKQWHDKVFQMVKKGSIEDQNTFLILNHSAVHHEKAKTLLQFYLLHEENTENLVDARKEMTIAWGTLDADFSEWRM